MKKLLSIAAVAALLSTGAIADNTLTVNGIVEAGALVSFGSAPVGNVVAGTFTFQDTTINFNSALVLGQENFNNQDVFVKTNSSTGVSLALTTTPDLSDGNNTIPTTYKFGATQFVAGVAQVYMERIMKMDFMVVQKHTEVHFMVLITCATFFTLGSSTFPFP